MAFPPRPWSSPTNLAFLLWTCSAVLGLGCSAQSTTPEKVQAAPTAENPEAATPEAKTPEPAEAKTPPPLTEEDLALIATDPKDLTPEMRRKRAYARRRQIMQDPDSPTARALNDLVEAHQAGDIDVNGGKKEGVWFSVPGSKPTAGRPPAGWRPPEGQPAQAKPAPAEGQPAQAEPAQPQAQGQP